MARLIEVFFPLNGSPSAEVARVVSEIWFAVGNVGDPAIIEIFMARIDLAAVRANRQQFLCGAAAAGRFDLLDKCASSF